MAIAPADAGRVASLACAFALLACTGHDPGSVMHCASGEGTCGGASPYLGDRDYRRAELELSLVSRTNEYAKLRLAHYATGAPDDWEALPAWNPNVAAARIGGGVAPSEATGAALTITDGARAAAPDDLLALGEAAFSRYPVQALASAGVALASADQAARYGFWTDPAGSVGGLVRTQMADGSFAWEMTCSTCHAASSISGLEPGRANSKLDLGRLIVEAHGDASTPIDVSLLRWGPGRLDVTTATGVEPVRIPDLRTVRWQPYLHADATVANRDVTALAIRIETLIVVSQNQVVRPPREVALGLATYLLALGSSLPSRTAASPDEVRGEELFATLCASCHVPPEYAGPPVPIETVGTDPTVGQSADRGTGMYRVPSLRGVSTRGPLLHDGSVRDLDSMFDPQRLQADYAGGRLGQGPVRGHSFGLDWTEPDRAALLSYLRTL